MKQVMINYTTFGSLSDHAGFDIIENSRPSFFIGGYALQNPSGPLNIISIPFKPLLN